MRRPTEAPKILSVNLIAGLVIAAFSALLLWVSYLPHESSLSMSLDSMYWPRLVLWSLLAFSLFLSAERLWVGTSTAEPGDGEREPQALGSSSAIALLCCAAYFVLIGLTGFLVSTLLFCAIFPALLGCRDLRRVAAFSLGVTGSLWVLVIVLMRVPLPRGIGVFRDISVFFY